MTEYNSFIYGTDPTERIVGCEVQGGCLSLWIESESGAVRHEVRHHSFWNLSSQKHNSGWTELQGNNHYRYRRYYGSRQEMAEDRLRHDTMWGIWDDREAAMVNYGFTYFKGMKATDVSVLAFDIEATGIEHGRDSKVLLISNTYRSRGSAVRRLFAHDEFESQGAMFEAWSDWVQEMNPALIVGHNLYGYDLPYLDYCARRAGNRLRLGRDNRDLYIPERESKYRRDGSQFYSYRNARIHGREIVDTFFLAMKYDVGRKFESYGLKYIVAKEGLEVPGRQHYDASTIRHNYTNPTEWAKIKAYAIHDADDALALFDRMVPAYFYLNQSIPKPFQALINGASGSWLNSFLVRSYLAEGRAIPKESEAKGYEGAISIGNPGVYQNVFKADIASLYPSIMLQYQVHDAAKDPQGHFIRMVEHFTAERLANKRRSKETGDRYYSDLEQAQKIVINSAYGMLGCPGLQFNSPEKAAFVTTEGRRILTIAMDWAKEAEFPLVNADTDSISIASPSPWTEMSRALTLECLNSLSPARIRWEDDGTFDSAVVIAAKNYALKQGDKVKVKGASLKASMKEPRLRQFVSDVLGSLLAGNQDILPQYNQVARDILTLGDITPWCHRKTVTEAVVAGARTAEAKVLAALEGTDWQQGDKVHLYYALPAPGQKKGPLKQRKDWCHDHDTCVLLRKLFDTVCIFETVVDVAPFPNYALKRNKAALHQLFC